MLKILAGVFVLVGGLAAFSAAQAEGGCGWGFHRGPWGGCRANGGGPAYVARPGVVIGVPGAAVVVGGAPGAIYVPGGRACPYGYHLGPQGRRCWPN
jgi:hypothetical protein